MREALLKLWNLLRFKKNEPKEMKPFPGLVFLNQGQSLEEVKAEIKRDRDKVERLQILCAIAPARVGHQDPANIVEEAEWLWECFEAAEAKRVSSKTDQPGALIGPFRA